MITFTPHIGMRSRSVIRLWTGRDETAVAINPKNPRNIIGGRSVSMGHNLSTPLTHQGPWHDMEDGDGAHRYR